MTLLPRMLFTLLTTLHRHSLSFYYMIYVIYSPTTGDLAACRLPPWPHPSLFPFADHQQTFPITLGRCEISIAGDSTLSAVNGARQLALAQIPGAPGVCSCPGHPVNLGEREG